MFNSSSIDFSSVNCPRASPTAAPQVTVATACIQSYTSSSSTMRDARTSRLIHVYLKYQVNHGYCGQSKDSTSSSIYGAKRGLWATSSNNRGASVLKASFALHRRMFDRVKDQRISDCHFQYVLCSHRWLRQSS